MRELGRGTEGRPRLDPRDRVVKYLYGSKITTKSSVDGSWGMLQQMLREIQYKNADVKGASLLRKIKIPSRFENVRMDLVAAPYMLNGPPHYAALKCEDPFTANEIQLE